MSALIDHASMSGRVAAVRTIGMIPERRDRSLPIIAMLAGLTLLGSIAFLPSPEEKVAVLMAVGQYDKAISVLYEVEQGRELNGYEAHALNRLYLLTEQEQAAIDLLDRQAAFPDRVAWSLVERAKIYRALGDYRSEAASLSRLFEIDATALVYRRLLIIYRLLGQFEDEVRIVELGTKAGLSTQSDLERRERILSGLISSRTSVVWQNPSSGKLKLHETETPPAGQMIGSVQEEEGSEA
jgi:tetratricopeptide (TPR) repeat protein